MANYLEVPQPIIVELKGHWIYAKDLDFPAGLKFEAGSRNVGQRRVSVKESKLWDLNLVSVNTSVSVSQTSWVTSCLVQSGAPNVNFRKISVRKNLS